MNRKSLTAFFSVVVLLIARPILAQTPSPGMPATSTHPPRWSVDGLGGITFSHEPGGVIAGGVSVRASQHVQIVGEGGRLTNVLPQSTSDALNTAAAAQVANGNSGFIFDAKMPGYYGLGSVRITASPSHSGLAPFVEGGMGIAHLTTNVTATSGGVDLTDTFLASVTPTPFGTLTKPMFIAGGGLSIAAGRRSAVDLGYRYSRILTDATTTAITTNRLYGGVRVGF